MRFRKKAEEKLIGIDFSDFSIEAVELGRRSTIAAHNRIVLDPGIINDGAVADEDRATDVLLDALSKKAFTGRSTVIAIPENQVLCHLFDIPAEIGGDEVHEYVKNEAGRFIPHPFGDLYYDYIIFEYEGKDENEGRKGVFFAGAPRQVVNGYRSALARAGLELRGIDIASLATVRALANVSPKERTLVADIGACRTALGVVSGGVLEYSGSVPAGGDDIGKALRDKISFVGNASEAWKKKIRLDGKKTDDAKMRAVTAAAEEALERILGEMQTVAAYLNERKKPVSKIVLAGGTSLIRGIDAYISKRLKIKTEAGIMKTEPNGAWRGINPLFYATAVGLAMKAAGTEKEKNGINLLGHIPSKIEESDTIKNKVKKVIQEQKRETGPTDLIEKLTNWSLARKSRRHAKHPTAADMLRVKREQKKTPLSRGILAAAVLGAAGGILGSFAFPGFPPELYGPAETGAVRELRKETAAIDGTFVIPQKLEDGAGVYDVVVLEDSITEKITGTGKESVKRKASGHVTIYNNYGVQPQKLVKNTRFESPEGLIFRMPEAVTVPGQATNDAGETVPGSIAVFVEADKAGGAYNIGPSRFTIPGLAGTALFDEFVATSTAPMRGGRVGAINTISDAERESAEEVLKEALRAKLFASARKAAQEGRVFFPGASSVIFGELEITNDAAESGADDAVEVRLAGAMTAPFFDKALLSALVVREINADASVGEQALIDFEPLAFEPERDGFNEDAASIAATIRGTTTIRYLQAE